MVLGLALSLNCKRVRVDVCCRLVRDNDKGDNGDRSRLLYNPVLWLREDGLAVWASNTDTVAIDVTLLLNAEATDRIAASKKMVFVIMSLGSIDFLWLLIVFVSVVYACACKS